MHYAIRHLTRFRYLEPVRESIMEVMMQPRSEGTQRLHSFTLQTSPRAQSFSYNDHLGNIVHSFDVLKPHKELLIDAQARVEVGAPPPVPERVPAEAWGGLETSRLDHDAFDMLMLGGFARPTERLHAFMLREKIVRGPDPLTTAQELSRHIHGAFDYDTEATKVDSPIDHALELGRGVCQDFSHIFIACARLLGIPARYVSGYLRHTKEGDGRSSPAATHSWVETFIPGLGWVGFDPTNGTLADERHIRVALGRDYTDVPPTRGVFKGKPESELAYAVSVALADAPQRPGEQLRIAVPLVIPESEEQLEELRHQQQQQQ